MRARGKAVRRSPVEGDRPAGWSHFVVLGLLVACAWVELRWSLAFLLAILAVQLLARVPRAPALRICHLGVVVVGLALGVLGLNWSAERTGQAIAARASQSLAAMRVQAVEIAGAISKDGPMELGSAGAFARMAAALGGSKGPGTTVLLVDEDGVADSWAGGGLRHPLPENELPEEGWLILESFTATTVAWIAPLGGSSGTRLIVGRSESAIDLPADWQPPCRLRVHCPSALSGLQDGRVWRLELGNADGSSATVSGAAEDGVVRRNAGEFTLSLRESEVSKISKTIGVHFLVLLLGLSLLQIDWSVRVWRRWSQGVFRRSDALEPLLVGLGAISVGIGSGSVSSAHGFLFGAQLAGLSVLAVAVLVAVEREQRPRPTILVVLSWAFAVAGAWVAVQLAENRVMIEPGVVAVPSISLLVSMLLSHGSLALGLSLVPSREGLGRRLGARWAAVAVGLALMVVTQVLWIALCGALLAALRLPLAREARGGRTVAATALWVLVWSGGVNGMIWSLVQEKELSDRMLHTVVADDSPFSGPGRWRVESRLERHFQSVDVPVSSLGLKATGGWADDLALFLWATSPLRDLDGPSGLRVREGARTAFFGFGLQQSSTDEEPFLEQGNTPARREWMRDAMMRGRAEIARGDAGPLEIEWYALPLPAGAHERRRSLAYRFLLGEPALRRSWFPNAALRLGPWEGQAMLDMGSLGTLSDERLGASTEAEPVAGASFLRALQLRLGQIEVMERWFEESFVLVRLHWTRDGPLGLILRAVRMASTTLLAVLIAGSISALLILLARRRPLSLALGPFSRRLMLVFSVFTVVPIVLLTVLLLQSFSAGLRSNQQEAGERALQSAERMLGDYISSLEPGFSVTAALDADLLSWVSSIVRHEVNLYWRGAVLTASRPEIFAAGVLPNQIPGEVYANLERRRSEVASRRNQTATETEYLELYREVEFPGVERSDLFVSVPLLAQEAETALTQRRMLAEALTLATVLGLLLVFVALRFASAFTEPIRAIVVGTARIAEGADELGLRPSIPELRELAEAIDEMAGTIAAGRERLVREKQVVDTVIANIKSAVVSFGREDRVIMVNREAADLLRVRPGDSLEDVAATLESPDWRGLIERRPQVPERISIRIGEAGEDAGGGEWTVQWLPIAGEGDPAALLVLEDVTEVLRAQRLEAWAEMARIIAHEVKNPLTPIRLSADHLRRVYENEPDRVGEVFDRCIDNILAQVEELRLIAGEFSIYSRIPTAERRSQDLVETVRQVTESYRAASTDELRFDVQLPEEPLTCLHDRRLIGRVLRNLYENSIRACGGTGHVRLQFEVVDPESGQAAAKASSWARIRVADSGPGVSPRDLERIFEPSFSASSGGTGLGLPIARGIIEEHGGEIDARNRSDGPDEAGDLAGLEVSILLPLSERPATSSSSTAASGNQGTVAT